MNALYREYAGMVPTTETFTVTQSMTGRGYYAQHKLSSPFVHNKTVRQSEILSKAEAETLALAWFSEGIQ